MHGGLGGAGSGKEHLGSSRRAVASPLSPEPLAGRPFQVPARIRARKMTVVRGSLLT